MSNVNDCACPVGVPCVCGNPRRTSVDEGEVCHDCACLLANDDCCDVEPCPHRAGLARWCLANPGRHMVLNCGEVCESRSRTDCTLCGDEDYGYRHPVVSFMQ